MSAELDRLLARAFHRGRAVDANQEIAKVRAERASAGEKILSYEIVVPADEPMKHLVEEVLPRLIYFLDCRGAALPRCPDVFASLFVGDALHFVETEALLDELSRASGLSFDELVDRFGASGRGR
jgi:hypothetical protein